MSSEKPDRRGRHAAVTATGLAGIGVAAWLALADAPPPGPVEQASSRSTPVPSPLRFDPTTRPAWHGQRTLGGTYQMHMGLVADVHAPGQPAHAQMTLDSDLTLHAPNSADAKEGWLVGRLTRVKFGGDATLRDQFGAKVAGDVRAFEQPFAIRFDTQGEVAEKRFAPELPQAARNLVSSLAAGLQVSRGKSDPLREWTRNETGTTGLHRATYREPEHGRLIKSWQRAADGGSGVTGKGDLTVTYQGALLAQAAYRYLLVADLTLTPQVTQRYEYRTEATLLRTNDTPAGWVDAVVIADLRTDSQLQPPVRRAPTPPTGQPVQATLETSAKASAKLDWQGRRAAMRELAANLRADPKTLQEVATRLRQPGLEGDALRTLLEALATAETPEALAELTLLLADAKAPYYARHSAVTLVSTIGEPPAALLDQTRKLSLDPNSDVYLVATLALAAQARLQQDRDPALAETLRAELLIRAAAVLGPAAKAAGIGIGTGTKDASASTEMTHSASVWLKALANMGGDDIWPWVAPFLVSQEHRLRRDAVLALATLTLPAARIALAKSMQKDPDAHIRAEAASVALSHPQWALEEPVLRALREDPSPHVRTAAGYTVAVWAVTYPGLVAELQQAIAAELHPEAKKMLTGLLPEDVTAKITKSAAATKTGDKP